MLSPTDRRWSPQELDRVIRESERLLGAPLADLVAQYHRGRTGTPASREHRLVELLVRARDAAAAPGDGLLEDAAAVTSVELDAVLAICDEWSQDAVWPEFQRMLQDPGQYLHAISTLAVASALRVRHPDTRLVASGQSGRTADLLLEVPQQHGLRVEVKAPGALYRAPHPLDAGVAMDTVRRAIKKAGTGAGGQLAAPGILVIAGWAMSEETFEVLSAGISAVLSAFRGRKLNLFGIAEFNMRFTPVIENGRVSVRQEQVSRLHRHPHYTGNLTLDGDWAAQWTLRRRT
jgi:hypothetical protein